jgi:hypothetical protein
MSDTFPASTNTIHNQTLPTTKRRLSLNDWQIVGGLIVLVLAITAIPYLYAYYASPPDKRFQGIALNVPDTVQYFSWLRDHQHSLLVPNRMTPEANEPALFNLLWLVVGQVGNLTGWSFATLFQLLRLVAGAGLFLALYAICRQLTNGRPERLTAYLVATLGAGLGWIWIVVKYLSGSAEMLFPRDLYTYEPNSFVITMHFPHFSIATALICAIFSLYLLTLQKRSWWYALATALVALTLTLQHAYDLLIIGLVPAGALLLMLLRDKRIPWFGGFALGLVGLLAVPPAAYFTILTLNNPLWKEVLAQFDNAGVFTPPPHHLLILMGLPLIVTVVAGVLGLPELRKRGLAGASDSDLFLWSWLLVGFALLYVPTDFQIHMLTAWQVPTAIIAARTLHRRLLPALQSSRPRLAQAIPLLFLLAVLPTNLYYVGWRLLDLSRHQAPYYLSSDEQAALEWLGQQATTNTVVFSGLNLGQYVPVYSDGRTFMGHWAQTVDYHGKQAAVERFFAPATPASEREELIERYAINYVLVGPEERSFGSFAPAKEPVFSSGEVAIYQVGQP